MAGESRTQTTSLKSDDEIQVTLRYKNIEKSVQGKPDAVLKEISSFLSTLVPNLDLAARISLNVDLNQLLGECEGVLAVTPEDVVVLKGQDKLTDREVVLLSLVRARIANFSGKVSSDSVPSGRIVEMVKKGPGTVAGRLSELANEGLVERVGKGEYKITTFGLQRFREEVLPKMKAGA